MQLGDGKMRVPTGVTVSSLITHRFEISNLLFSDCICNWDGSEK